MDSNWRAALAQDSRQKIVNKIMETLQRHMPPSGQEGMHELRKIAWRFEEKIFQAATDQHDYLRKISLKMLSLETRTQNAPNSSLSANCNGSSSFDSASLLVQQPMRDQGHTVTNGLQQPPAQQQALPVQSGIMPGGMQSSSGLGSSLSSLSGLSQGSISNVAGQGSGLPNITGMGQSSLTNTTGQSLPQNVLLGNQRLQLHPRQQQVAVQQPPPQQQVAGQQQQQQQSVMQQQQQQQQQMLYQQRLQQQTQILKQKLQQQSFVQQQQSMQQSALQQQQPQSLLQQQQHTIPILQSQQQPQSLLIQQNNVQSLQQQQQQLLQQQLLQQAKAHHQQHTQQTGGSLATLLSQPQQHQTHIAQQTQPASLLSQPQQQSPLLSQPHNQQLQQQSTSIHEQQQRLQQSSGFTQQANTLEYQKQLLQVQQRGFSEASSTSLDSSGQTGQSGVIDPQDIVWAKMQILKEKYLQDMKDLFEMLRSRSQQPMPPEQLQKLTHYRNVLHRMIPYLVAPKGTLPAEFKQDKVDAFEKQIANIMETFKRRKQTPQQQPVQSLQPQQQTQNVASVQSSQQQQTHQSSQMLQQNKSMPPVQQLNAQTGGTSFQSNNLSALQQNTGSILQATSTSMQHSMVNSMQPNALNLLQGSGINSLQQNCGTSLQQGSVTTLQSSVSLLQQQQHVLQQDQQQLMQAQQQRISKDQEQLKQLQQRQSQHHQQQQQQLLQHKQQGVQLHAQLQTHQHDVNSDMKVDLKAKQAAAMKQVILHQHQINQRALLQQQLQQQQQPPKIGQAQTVSSPQIFQAASPQILQQMSPQIDQPNVVTPSAQVPSFGTPLQSTPPFMTPSPSLHPAASPMLEDMEMKVCTPAISTITSAASNQIFQSTVATPSNAQSSTPGLSTSPLLGDFLLSPQNIAAQDGAYCVSPGTSLEEKNLHSEPPLERLIKMINSMSPKALSSAISDIGSLIGLSDKMAGSAPGCQSRAVVGEDLALLTKCKLQARAFLSQEGNASTKGKRHLDSMALSVVSSDGSVVNSLQKMSGPDTLDILSTATSRVKRPRFEISSVLEEEIRQINNVLIDTSVEISDDAIEEAAVEGKEGVVVTCLYNAVAMNPNIPFRSNLFHMVSISPMRLLIPSGYPDCSPIVLTDLSAPDFNHPISRLARDEFGRVLRCLPPPVSLGAIARAWDECAHNAVAEAAALNGGGCFSSSYGIWESCVSA